jgi:hypothetical protein
MTRIYPSDNTTTASTTDSIFVNVFMSGDSNGSNLRPKIQKYRSPKPKSKPSKWLLKVIKKRGLK